MLYRDYGKTGKKVSALGFGGMRFDHVDNHDECVRMMVTAAKGGVNYFDTAPGYFETRSETVFGKGFAELKRLGLPYFCATKTFKTTEKDIRTEVEGQLKRLDIPAIDFYHIWCITNLSNWQERKQDNILVTFKKLKEEGLIKHICVSSHLMGRGIEDLLMEGVFEGVLFGYSAYNYKTRGAAFKAIQAKELGAVVMNPLGGGIIPQHPERFQALQRSDEGLVPAALSFLWDHKDITCALVGFQNEAQVSVALNAADKYRGRTEEELAALKEKLPGSMEGLCTGCAYCDDCPLEIPIPQYMDAYNQKLLSVNNDGRTAILDRLRWHWSLEAKDAGKCTACGLCEKACTQHINIIERLKEIAG
jgi:predicted aldo/keto reductase-like oxidoreductase